MRNNNTYTFWIVVFIIIVFILAANYGSENSGYDYPPPDTADYDPMDGYDWLDPYF